MAAATIERDERIAFCFELDAESIAAAAAGDSGLPTSWIQVMIVGKFTHPASGKFEITAADLEAFAADIGARGSRIPIDFDHDSGIGRSSRAAGWFTGKTQILNAGDQRPDGTAATTQEEWAEVEWTPVGQEAVRSHEYRYVSPEFGWRTRDPVTGKLAKRHRVHATALTNRPFLPDMQPVRLSEIEVPKPSSGAAHDNEGGSMDTTVFAAALGLKDDADEKAILAALKERDDQVKASEARIAELEKSVLPDDTIKQLTESAAKGEQAAKDLHDMKRDQLLKDAVEDGKILPAQKDGYASMYDVDPKSVQQLLDATPAKSFKPVGVDGQPGSDGGDGSEPGTVTVQGSDIPVDEHSFRLSEATLAVLKEQGKTFETATAGEYSAAAQVAERKLRSA